MNHYTLLGKHHTYCVFLSKNKKRAFQTEAENSEEVFEERYNKILNHEKKERHNSFLNTNI